MAEMTITSWQCDRCGHAESTSPGAEPEAWRGIDESNSPRSSEGHRLHFCGSCSASYVEWKAAGHVAPEPEPEADPGEPEPDEGGGEGL